MENYKTIHENKVMINPPEEVKKTKQSPLQRINRILLFNYKRGNNKESVNSVLRNIIKGKFCPDKVNEGK